MIKKYGEDSLARKQTGQYKIGQGLVSVGFATGTEEAVERVADGSCNDEYIGAWDSPIRDCRISEVYRMTGEQIREYFNL